jgi:putative GTP pyrophosphokinase
MARTYSKTTIDQLGDRLRRGDVTDSDVRLLDNYRRSFGEAYESVVSAIRSQLGLEPTGRPAKSTASIIEKLNRESIRLVQMQDIAGCRVIAEDAPAQDSVVNLLLLVFTEASVVDRRASPSYGYRAVHVIVKAFGKLVEVQVRTPFQHSWAELSEKLSDTVDPRVKYGGGDPQVQRFLALASEAIATFENYERRIGSIRATLADLPEGQRRDQVTRELEELGDIMEISRAHIRTVLLDF